MSPQFQLRPQYWNWTGLKRAIDSRIQSQSTGALTPDATKGLRFFWIDGVFASLSDNIFISFLGLFALTYGASNGQIGLLTAATNLFAVAGLFPGAAHADRTPHRKRMVVWTGGIAGRLLIIPLVLVPFFDITAGTAIWVIILANGLRNFMNSYANPAWTGLVADLVPVAQRSRYFAERNFTMGLAALAVSLLGGMAIRRLAGSTGNGLLGYQVVFGAALLFGALSTGAFARIPEPADSAVPDRTARKERLRTVLGRNPDFVAFLIGAFIWNTSVQAAAPFFNVFLVNELSGTAETVGLAAAIATGAGLLGQLAFGALGSRRGNLAIIRWTGPLIPLMPLLWGLSTQAWHSYPVSFVGGVVWAGFNLANFNLLLELCPQDARSRSVALFQAVVFASAVIGPVIGGLLIDLFSYRAVFMLTGVARYAGVAVFLALIRRRRLVSRSGVTLETN